MCVRGTVSDFFRQLPVFSRSMSSSSRPLRFLRCAALARLPATGRRFRAVLGVGTRCADGAVGTGAATAWPCDGGTVGLAKKSRRSLCPPETGSMPPHCSTGQSKFWRSSEIVWTLFFPRVFFFSRVFFLSILTYFQHSLSVSRGRSTDNLPTCTGYTDWPSNAYL